VLDKSKIPTDLVLHRVWVPQRASDARPWVAYLSDRRRRTIGAALFALSLIGVIVAVATSAGFWLAFASLLIAWAGVAYASRGRTGFYNLREDGSLGDYLGRSPPDLTSMVPIRRC
jgi:hypothetical protein